VSRPHAEGKYKTSSLATSLSSRPVVFAVCLFVMAAMGAPFLDHTVDDAFISFRYADNLASGLGLVFNPGERVEGYSNFLWCLLLAPLISLGIDPVLAARALGILSAIALLAGVVRFAPRPEALPGLVWLAPLLTAGSPALAVWTTGGLEAPLFAALVVWSVGLAVEGLGREELAPASALLAAVAALTRPDGLGVFLVLVVLLAWAQRSQRNHLRDLGRWSAWFAAVYLPYFAWRLIYYGDLLPNTFHAKVGFGLDQVVRGLDYYAGFLSESGWWLLLPLLGLPWCRDERSRLMVGGMALGWGSYVALIGGDGLPMYRFLVPILPLFYLLLAHGVVGILERFTPTGAMRLLATLLLALITTRAALPAFGGPSALYVEQDRREVAAWVEMGRYFDALATGDESIAVIAAGAVPYYSRLVAIDMLGLNDRTIARREVPALGRGQAGHEKFDVDYVLDREPTFVLIGAYETSEEPRPAAELIRPHYPAEKAMLASPRFRRHYRAVRARLPSGHFAYFERTAEPD
jgi:arabinofuranosyltransferase